MASFLIFANHKGYGSAARFKVDECFFLLRMIPESTSLTETWSQKLNNLQKDMDHLAKKQSQLDRENMLADEEESILQRKEELEIYEKEVTLLDVQYN